MKILIPLTLSSLQAAYAFQVDSIAANSRAGTSLLSKSRLLEDKNEGGDDAYDTTWMQDYSIKFLGCHHVAHWNSNAQEQDEVKITTDRHVRFRLCPTSSCSHNTALGCSSGYGDYIADMDTFLQYYLQNKEEIKEEQCENRLSKCGCGQNDGDDDEKCEYKCFINAGMTQCIDRNPYYDDAQQQEEDKFELKDYTYCTEYKVEEEEDGEEDGEENGEEDGEENGEERKRKLDQEEVQYFLGAYCADKGDEIHLGLFTDDTCTQFADSKGGRQTFYEQFGSTIPYHGESLVDNSCYTCKDYDYYDGDVNTREICEDIYQIAGKCESKIADGVLDDSNENACNYIDGLKLLKHSANGIIYRQYYGSRKAAIAIALFATMFIVLAFYACYLRKLIKLKETALLTSRREERSSSPTPQKKGFLKTFARSMSPRNLKKKISFSNRSRKNKAGALL